MKPRLQLVKRSSPSSPEPSDSAAPRWVSKVLSWPRGVRIALVAGLSLVITLISTPLIDAAYIRFFFQPETVILPSLVSVGAGLVMYLLGWKTVIGTVGELPRSDSGALWYLILGVVSLLVAVVLLITGVISGNQPTT